MNTILDFASAAVSGAVTFFLGATPGSPPAGGPSIGTWLVAVPALISAYLAYRQATKANRDTTRLETRKQNLEENEALQTRAAKLQEQLDAERQRRFAAEEQVAVLRRSLIGAGHDLPLFKNPESGDF